jgi:hypothetical protein
MIVCQVNRSTELMIGKDSDVTSFNTSVRQLMNAYFATKREEVDAETLLTNLFDAYKACKDNYFITYIKQKKHEHNEGGASTLTPEKIMDFALKQYQTQLQECTWGMELAEKKEIMPLTAEVVTLKQQLDDSKRVSSEQWQKRRYEEAPTWTKNPPTDPSEQKVEGNYKFCWCP